MWIITYEVSYDKIKMGLFLSIRYTKNMVMNYKVNIIEISNGIISKYHSQFFKLLFLARETKQQLVGERIPFYSI